MTKTMIGKNITFVESGFERKEGIVLDKVLIEETIYKHSEWEAPKRGFNYTDGENVVGSISVTAYLIQCEGHIITIKPFQIKSIND